MRVEIPELHRCCCCLPLRRGLLFWVYLKLLFAVLAVWFFTNALAFEIRRGRIVYHYVVISIALIMFVIDIAFCLLFIISAHRKKHEHMRIYYRYGFGTLIVGIIAFVGFIGLAIYIAVISSSHLFLFVDDMVHVTSFVFVNLVLQTYLMLLVRSETLKLKNNAQFEFINNTNEPVCKAQIAA